MKVKKYPCFVYSYVRWHLWASFIERLFNNYVIFHFDKDYTIDIFFRQWWKDPRLAHGQDKVFNAALDPSKLGKGIWTPDTYFRNVKNSNYHSVSRDNMRLRISKDGSIYYSAR